MWGWALYLIAIAVGLAWLAEKIGEWDRTHDPRPGDRTEPAFGWWAKQEMQRRGFPTRE